MSTPSDTWMYHSHSNFNDGRRHETLGSTSVAIILPQPLLLHRLPDWWISKWQEMSDCSNAYFGIHLRTRNYTTTIGRYKSDNETDIQLSISAKTDSCTIELPSFRQSQTHFAFPRENEHPRIQILICLSHHQQYDVPVALATVNIQTILTTIRRSHSKLFSCLHFSSEKLLIWIHSSRHSPLDENQFETRDHWPMRSLFNQVRSTICFHHTPLRICTSSRHSPLWIFDTTRIGAEGARSLADALKINQVRSTICFHHTPAPLISSLDTHHSESKKATR